MNCVLLFLDFLWPRDCFGSPLLQASGGRVRLSDVSEAIVTRSDNLPTGWLLVALGLLLSVLGAMATWRWARRRQMVVHHGWWTFSRLAAEVGLGWRDRWLLWRISRQQQLPNPLTLLFSPATLRHHADRYAGSRSFGRRVIITARVASIRRRLFG